MITEEDLTRLKELTRKACLSEEEISEKEKLTLKLEKSKSEGNHLTEYEASLKYPALETILNELTRQLSIDPDNISKVLYNTCWFGEAFKDDPRVSVGMNEDGVLVLRPIGVLQGIVHSLCNGEFNLVCYLHDTEDKIIGFGYMEASREVC